MPEKPLEGKTALVTGACRNLGAVTARVLAGEGADIIINDLDQESLRPVAERLTSELEGVGIKAVFIGADLGSSVQTRELCRKALHVCGHVDILVNNAGPFAMDPYLALKEETWNLVMDVNVKAIYLTAQELAPRMKENGWGRIINMCAGSAFVRNHGVYSLAKAAVQVLTESLALELGPEITVNAIAPGQILESLPDIETHDPTFGARYRAHAPLKRLVKREEIARAVALLCTPEFDCMTGCTLRIDGGSEIPRF